MIGVRLVPMWNRNKKFLKVSRDARLLWVDMDTYCNELGTDGFIPREAADLVRFGLSSRAFQKCVRELIGAGLLEPKFSGSLAKDPPEIGDSHEAQSADERPVDGWFIHDFLVHNLSAAAVRDIAEKRSRSGQEGANARWGEHGKRHGKRHGNSHESSHDQADGKHDGSRARSDGDSDQVSDPTDQVGGADAPPPTHRSAQSAPSGERPPALVQVLTNPEPGAPKPARKPRQQPLAVKVAPAAGWKLWRELYGRSKRAYGRYVDAPEDGAEMGRIVNAAIDQAIAELRVRCTPQDPVEPVVSEILQHWFKEYLRDDGGERGWIAEQRHPLRYVLKGVTKYGTPWSRARGSTGVPQEAQQARAALVASTEVPVGP